MTNSSPARSQISRSSAATSSRTRVVDLGQALDVEPHARDLHRAQHAHERQLDLVHAALQPALARSARAARRPARWTSSGVGGRRVLDVGREPALLARARGTGSRAGRARAGRRRAACRGRGSAGPRPAPWRRARSTGRSPSAGDELRPASSQSPTSTSSPRGERRSAAAARAANSSPSGVSGASDRQRGLGVARRRRSARRARSPRARAPRRERRRDRRRRRRVGAPSASSRRRSGSRSSNSRKTSRSRERSGSRGRLVRGVDVHRHVALDRRQALGDARVVGVVDEVLLALGAGDLVDAAPARPRA